MNIEDLELRASAIYGREWQTQLSRLFGVDSRTVRRWKAGSVAVPTWVEWGVGIMERHPEEAEIQPPLPNENPWLQKPANICALQIRSLVFRILKVTNEKKVNRSHHILGYSPMQLRQRIEFQFQPGMTWANHGDWHIDHKKPVSAFIRQGITDPKTINALCNLQPLWARDNLSKGSLWQAPANDNQPPHIEETAAA